MSAASGPTYDIKTFLAKHRDFNASVTYELDELKWLIGRVRMVMADEKALIDVKHPVNIVGDIHGQYQDLHRIFNACGMPANRTRYLFLGDYVDRGPQSLEVICCLLGLKIAFPTKIFLLRGNHEQEFINKDYGFWAELEKRFAYGLALGIFKEFNDLFGYLPLAALVSGKILCMHGGLSPHLNSVDDIRSIELPQVVVQDKTLVQDILWADPAIDQVGFADNKLREVSVTFGEDVVYKTCQRLKLDMIVRGHQVMRNGYGFFANRRLVTVFSAPMYDTTLKNRGAVLVIARDKTMRFYMLNPLERKEEANGVGFKASFVDDQSGYNVREL
uniref:Serine/threonine-protein phosphatase n=1 Tax=Steinernema glaseri TaxID=37863 RepID=A0A1I8A235_9BILA